MTPDNWFSFILLALTLKEMKLIYVGTLRKNKAEVPPEFLPGKRKKRNQHFTVSLMTSL